MSMTQKGMWTAATTPLRPAVCTMAASGPTAFATSLAPWAKESSAAEITSGRLKSLRSDWLRFSMPSDWRLTKTCAAPQATRKVPRPMIAMPPPLR